MSDVDRCDDHGSWNEIDLARRSDGRHGDDHVNDYDGGRMNVVCLDDRFAIFLKTSGFSNFIKLDVEEVEQFAKVLN